MGQAQQLKDYLEEFVADHTLNDGDELLLNVTKEEIELLGIFFLRGMCGWVRSVNQSCATSLATSDDRDKETWSRK